MLKCSFPVALKPTPAAGAPAWVDPRAIMAQTAVRVTAVTTDMAGPGLLVAADPKRVALGFGIGGGGTVYVGPIADPNVGGFGVNNIAGNGFLWFTIFEHGPLVNLAWNNSAYAGGVIHVYEVYRLF